jgi:hypothetical protein
MPRTSPRVSFGLFALEIKSDSIPAASGLQPFAKVADLKTDNATYRPYATYEPDFWALDGQYKFLPANLSTVHVGLMSTAMSDGSGTFGVPPVLTINFHQVHSSDGLALKFSQYTGDYASSITIAFYDAVGALIREDSYTPESWEFATAQAVSDYKQIVITFLASSRPYRYLRLAGIDYGELITFDGAAIQEASVVEETDLLSLSVIYNALSLRLYSADAQFSILNPEGYYAGLKERQPLAVHVDVDNQSVYIGTYYLDEWENLSDTDIRFRCVDLLGVLDRIPYRGGLWLGAGVALETLIEAILGAVSVPYDLDTELYGVMVRGWIPICTIREALQQIAFSVGAYVDCGRSGAVKIYKTRLASAESSPAYTITKAEKGMGSSLALRALVTAAEVTAHNYLVGTETRELYNGALAAGTHEITFTEPMHDLTVSGATVTESGVNYALLAVAAPGTVVLSGAVYVDTQQVYRVQNTALGASVKPNVLQVTAATLVDAANVAEVTNRIYDYYQQRYRQEVTLYGAAIEPGVVVAVETLYNKQVRGVLERSEIDLARGFVSKCQIVGVEHVD